MDCDVYTIWLDRLHLFINANSHMDCDIYTIWLDRQDRREGGAEGVTVREPGDTGGPGVLNCQV